MKARNIFLSLLLVGIQVQVNGQYAIPVYSSFHADPKGVYWLKRFDQPGYSSEGLRERMLMRLQKNPSVRDVKMDASGNIVASIKNMKIDYKRLGVPFLKTSNKVSNGRWKGKIKVEVTDDQYRITIDHLEYFARIYHFHVAKVQAGKQKEFESGTVTDTFLNRSKSFFKKSSLKDLDLINFILTDQFSLIEERLTNPTDVLAAKSAGH